MIYQIETNHYDSTLTLLFSPKGSKKVNYANLYVKANSIESALVKAKKYLGTHKKEHLKIESVKEISGTIII